MKLIGMKKEEETPVIKRAANYVPRMLRKMVRIEPVEPTADLMASGLIVVPTYDPARGTRRSSQLNEQEEQRNQSVRNKLTHARVLAIGPDVTLVKVGDVVRFVNAPTENIINIENRATFVNCIDESQIYMVLDPAESEKPQVLQ